jgi:hypothetical protein
MPKKFLNRCLRPASSHLARVLVTLAAFGPVHGETADRVRIIESYPDKIQIRLDRRERLLRHAVEATGNREQPITVQYVLDIERKWNPGQTLTVAFSGGTPELRAKIESAASEWTRYCNIKFDFREKGKFREWSASDNDYHSTLRIAFMNGDDGGYWSALANDSVNPEYYPPNKASMNFEGFPSDLPSDYAATVKHEFGHALGFIHEHQHPQKGCDDQFRWDDDSGYVPTYNQWGEYIPDPQGRNPGVYTVFGGPPNKWCKEKIDFALRQLTGADSHAYKVGPFDPESIMKYYFADSLFIDGERSRCYHDENLKISVGDRQGAAAVYPKMAAATKRVLEEKKRVLEMVLQMKGLSPELEQHYRSQRGSLPK